ncbi:MAG: ferrous iron transport protein A [Firmicutes bacterium]|jgi:ferrous iron transport protein A|nr:ferrous iron transport protein A [Bacillota bacterium]
MPLTMCRAGDEVTIVRIKGNEDVRHHLIDLGFVENEKVRVISRLANNLIVVVKETRVALDEKMANRIMVH